MQEELHQARLKELDQMTSERDTARAEFETMRKQRLDEFMAGFSTITNKLKEMYQVRLSLLCQDNNYPKSNVRNCPKKSQNGLKKIMYYTPAKCQIFFQKCKFSALILDDHPWWRC